MGNLFRVLDAVPYAVGTMETILGTASMLQGNHGLTASGFTASDRLVVTSSSYSAPTACQHTLTAYPDRPADKELLTSSA